MAETNHEVEQFYSVEPTNRNGRRRTAGWKIWLLVLAGVLAVGALLSLAYHRLFPDAGAAESNGPYIAVLFVEGTIAAGNIDSWGLPFGYQHGFTLDQIDELIADQQNTGLVLFVDSPGGGIYESDELYLKLKEYKESTGRPLYAYMGSMAASGGYYVSAAADQIIANRNCWTGSIGVTIGTLVDISGFLERYGIRSVTITSGANKSMGNVMEPMTAEQQAIFQSLVDEAYEQFAGIVADERAIPLERVREIADGRIYSAAQALELGLIDGIAPYESALADLQSSYGLDSSEILEIRYQDNSFFGRLLGDARLPALPGGEAGAVLSLLKDDIRFPIHYTAPLLD